MNWTEIKAQAAIVRVWPEKGVYKMDTDAHDRDIALGILTEVMEQSKFTGDGKSVVIENIVFQRLHKEITHA